MSEGTIKTVLGWLRFAGLIVLAFLALTINIEIFALVGKGLAGFFAWIAAFNLAAEAVGIYYYAKEFKALDVIFALFKKSKKEEKPEEVVEEPEEEKPSE